jgi:hypothetical protein
MSSLPKIPYYIPLGASAYAVSSLDSGHYTSALATKLGLLTTAPAATTSTLKMTLRSIIATGAIGTIKLNCTSGTGDAKKRRSVPVICAIAKLGEIISSAKGESIALGGGTSGVQWLVDSVSV